MINARAVARAAMRLTAKASLLVIVWSASILGVMQDGLGAVEYTLADLGPGYAYGINNSDLAVGWSREPTRSFMWQAGTRTDIGTGRAYGVNDTGQVIGYYGTAWLQIGGSRTDLGTLPIPGHTVSEAYAINSLGDVAGMSARWDAMEYRACFWRSGTVTDLKPLVGGGDYSMAFGINNLGDVVGVAGSRAFAVKDGVAHDLYTGRFSNSWQSSQARDINDGRWVAGYAYNADTLENQAVIWEPDDTPRIIGVTGYDSKAYAINRSGVVVGHYVKAGGNRACIWRDGVMTDLNDLLPPGTGWVMTDAYDINDAGHIVGEGEYHWSGVPHAMLLVPEPATLLLLTLGSLVALRYRR